MKQLSHINMQNQKHLYISARTLPFALSFYSDGFEFAKTENKNGPNAGFNLNYQLNAC